MSCPVDFMYDFDTSYHIEKIKCDENFHEVDSDFYSITGSIVNYFNTSRIYTKNDTFSKNNAGRIAYNIREKLSNKSHSKEDINEDLKKIK